MSDQALYTKLIEGFGKNEKLAAFYDFDKNTTGVYGASTDYTGVFFNSSYSNIPNKHRCYIEGSQSTSASDALSKTFAITGSSKNLTSGAYKIDLEELNANNISAIIDFQFDGEVQEGVLFGSFITGQETFGDQVEQVSSGYNIGVTERGHLFCQSLKPEGNSIEVLTNVELSKRNVIGISSLGSSIIVSRFDYLNDIVDSLECSTDVNFTSNDSSIYLGGTEAFYKQDLVFSGHLNNFALFSGFIHPTILKEFGEGVIGDYIFTAQSSESVFRVTGYDQTVIYKTGITGYEYPVTGTLTLETGREMFTGSLALSSSEDKKEGERYYKYYTLNNGDSETFYKEEIGQLHSNSGFIYHPTGENAFDTLGLNDISESIQTYAEVSGLARRGHGTTDSLTINLHGKNALTGTLSEISGVLQTALSEETSTIIPASSGVELADDSEFLKKDYIYYMGGRS